MSKLHNAFKTTRLSIWLLLCVLILAATSVYAAGDQRPLAAVDILGSPDAAVDGKFAVGTATPGGKALTVAGVIDFVGAGTVHNYFTQGPGNNMQIRSNVDEYNSVGNGSYAQWNMVMGASLDVFSIRRSPASSTYNEDALFWIDGATGNVGVVKVDTSNGATIPFTLQARLHAQTTAGHAIWGVTTSTTGANIGVYGESESTSGYGVMGWAPAGSGYNYGVYGESMSTDGTGVFGYTRATSGPGYGVWGISDSSNGIGVYGWGYASSGYNYGVYGESNSTSGVGVGGWATSTTGNSIAIYGESYSTGGIGVQGYASASSGITYGVYGLVASTNGWAGYFVGDVNVTGTLSKSAGSFKIDHPLDPENKYLYHSFVESPDMMNIYNGVITLDDSGAARVELPDWFEALNKDFRYILTPIGAAMPNLHISEEIADNAFRIAGGEAGMKVTWMVTGIRHDPYAEDNRIPVEEDKDAGEKGTYLYPHGYDQPESRGLDYQATPHRFTEEEVDRPASIR
jgi:hypothetical protein